MKEMEMKEVISTGNPEIDKKLGGGIPKGSLTLVEGQSDSGKSVLVQQMSWGSLHAGFNVTFFTTENTVKSLVRQMESLNLDILDFLLLDLFRIYPIQIMKGKADLERIFRRLLHAVKREQKRADLIIIDSLTPFVTHTPIEETITFFEECKELTNEGLTLICVIHSYAFSENMLVRIRSMCDAHLRLRIEEVGDKLLKILEVAKIRGADRNTGNIVSFEVEPGWGMRIIPITKAKA